MAKVIPKVDNIPTAAIPIPYNPLERLVKSKLPMVKPEAKRKANITPQTTAITGIATDNIPVPNPAIITVAGPVCPLAEIFLVGL